MCPLGPAGMNLVDAAKAAGVKHFVWSSLEDTRPALCGLRPTLTGGYTVPHFDAKAEVEAYMRVEVRWLAWRGLGDTAWRLCRAAVPRRASRGIAHLPLACVLCHCSQLPGRCTALYASLFFENFAPGGGMEPQKQPDGSYALFMPVGDTQVGSAVGCAGPAPNELTSPAAAATHACALQHPKHRAALSDRTSSPCHAHAPPAAVVECD